MVGGSEASRANRGKTEVIHEALRGGLEVVGKQGSQCESNPQVGTARSSCRPEHVFCLL